MFHSSFSSEITPSPPDSDHSSEREFRMDPELLTRQYQETDFRRSPSPDIPQPPTGQVSSSSSGTLLRTSVQRKKSVKFILGGSSSEESLEDNGGSNEGGVSHHGPNISDSEPGNEVLEEPTSNDDDRENQTSREPSPNPIIQLQGIHPEQHVQFTQHVHLASDSELSSIEPLPSPARSRVLVTAWQHASSENSPLLPQFEDRSENNIFSPGMTALRHVVEQTRAIRDAPYEEDSYLEFYLKLSLAGFVVLVIIAIMILLYWNVEQVINELWEPVS